jgi:ribosomal protein S18 acetylase RimI-like enzyme
MTTILAAPDDDGDMGSGDLLAPAIANLVAWHESSVTALGFPGRIGRHWWTCPTPQPWIYFTAIELDAVATGRSRRASRDELDVHLDDPRGAFQAVCVSYDDVDLGAAGLTRRSEGRWYARPPAAAPPDEVPRDLEITEVRDHAALAEFEVATCAAFGSPPPTAPFDVHAPAVLDDPAMRILVGRHDGEVVCGAMGYVDDRVVGIYGVGTVPGQRARGYARALTLAVLDLAPGLAATLQPSDAAARMYRRLGFEEIGRFSHWG